MRERYDRDLEPVTAPEPATLPSELRPPRSALRCSRRLLAPLVVLLGVVLKFGAFSSELFGIFLAVGDFYALRIRLEVRVGVVLPHPRAELGHYVEAKRTGSIPPLPVFIPFPRGVPSRCADIAFDPWMDARVSLAGPVAGVLRGDRVSLVAAVTIDSDLLHT